MCFSGSATTLYRLFLRDWSSGFVNISINLSRSRYSSEATTDALLFSSSASSSNRAYSISLRRFCSCLSHSFFFSAYLLSCYSTSRCFLSFSSLICSYWRSLASYSNLSCWILCCSSLYFSIRSSLSWSKRSFYSSYFCNFNLFSFSLCNYNANYRICSSIRVLSACCDCSTLLF